jgi:hypothetical protein
VEVMLLQMPISKNFLIALVTAKPVDIGKIKIFHANAALE